MFRATFCNLLSVNSDKNGEYQTLIDILHQSMPEISLFFTIYCNFYYFIYNNCQNIVFYVFFNIHFSEFLKKNLKSELIRKNLPKCM